MLYYDRIGISEGIDIAKSNNSKECMFATFDFLIMASNFRNICEMVVVV